MGQILGALLQGHAGHMQPPGSPMARGVPGVAGVAGGGAPPQMAQGAPGISSAMPGQGGPMIDPALAQGGPESLMSMLMAHMVGANGANALNGQQVGHGGLGALLPMLLQGLTPPQMAQGTPGIAGGQMPGVGRMPGMQQQPGGDSMAQGRPGIAQGGPGAMAHMLMRQSGLQ